MKPYPTSRPAVGVVEYGTDKHARFCRVHTRQSRAERPDAVLTLGTGAYAVAGDVPIIKTLGTR